MKLKLFNAILVCVVITAISSCSGRSHNIAPNADANEETFAPIDWSSKSFEVKAAEDMLALHSLMSSRDHPILAPDEVESVIGIVGSTARYECIDAQKDLVDYEYDDGIRLTVAYFDRASHLRLYIDNDRLFSDENIISPDLSTLDLGSDYEDYVRVIGEKGVLIGVSGPHDLTFMWVNSEGHKLEATFEATSGLILTSYNYW